MSRRLSPVMAMVAALSLAGCAGGPTTGTAGVGSPEPAVSAPGASAPAASVVATSPPAGTADPGSATGACAPSTASGTVTAAMSGRAFTPGTIEAKVGDVIAWTNMDAVPHTATLRDDPTCTTERLGNGETGALTFSAAGTYAFFCKIHADMTGTIEVTG